MAPAVLSADGLEQISPKVAAAAQRVIDGDLAGLLEQFGLEDAIEPLRSVRPPALRTGPAAAPIDALVLGFVLGRVVRRLGG